MALEQITVKSTLPDDRLALHERHPDHPDGEAFVYGDAPKVVARTARVQRALADEWLVRVEGKDAKPVAEAVASEPANPPPPAEEVAQEGSTAPAAATARKK